APLSKLERDATLQSSGMLEVSAGPALLSAIVLFFVAAGIAWVTGRERRTSFPTPMPDKVPGTTYGIAPRHPAFCRSPNGPPARWGESGSCTAGAPNLVRSGRKQR